MDKNYSKTIEGLKQQGLLDNSYEYVISRYDQTLSWGTFFVGLGAVTIKWTDEDYIIAVNKDVLKIFFVSKATGDYLNKNICVDKSRINKLKCKKYLLGNVRIILRSKEAKLKLNFFTCNVFRKFEQTEKKGSFVEFVKEHYNY